MMSVIRKPEEDPVTPKQLGIKPDNQGLEVVVISDGELSKHSVALSGKDENWIKKRLEERGLKQADVFLMTIRTDGKWRIIENEKAREST